MENITRQMVKHLDTANKASAGIKSESKNPKIRITKRQLRKLIREVTLNEEGPMGALVQQFADTVDLDTRSAVSEYVATKVADCAAQNITAQEIFPEALRKTGLATEVDMQIEEIIGGAIRDMSDVITDQIMDRIQEVLPETVK